MEQQPLNTSPAQQRDDDLEIEVLTPAEQMAELRTEILSDLQRVQEILIDQSF